MNKILSVLAFLPILIIAGCGDSVVPTSREVAAPAYLTEAPVGIQFVAQTGAVPTLAPMAEPANGVLHLDKALLNVRYIQFRLPDGVDCKRYGDDLVVQNQYREQERDREEVKDGSDDDDLEEGNRGDDKEVGQDTDQDPMYAAPDSEEESLEDDADSVAEEDSVDGDDADEGEEQEFEEGRSGGDARTAHCDGDKIRFNGPFVVSLTDGTSVPPLENLAIPAGTYDEIEVKIDDAEEKVAGAPLPGRTLLAEGHYATAETTVEIRIGLKFDEEMAFSAPDGILIGAAGGSDFVVQFPIQSWLSGVDLSACFANAATGGVNLDEEDGSECDGLEDQIKNNFKQSARTEKQDRGEADD